MRTRSNSTRYLATVLALLTILERSLGFHGAFSPCRAAPYGTSFHQTNGCIIRITRHVYNRSTVFMTATSFDALDNDEEEPEPGKMRVAEIKAELDLRGIDYMDCFDKESLLTRLVEARTTGQADPNILEKFNKQKLEETFKEDIVKVSDEDIQQAVANDGTLPGGLTPDMFKKLTSNPEIMTMLQSTKVQEAMKLMMTGGREQLEQKLQEDPDLEQSIEKLTMILRSVQ